MPSKITLLSLNINPEIVTEYMDLLGDVEFVRNQDQEKGGGMDNTIWFA